VELPLADVDVATKAGKYVLYVLAVAGGFLVGNVVTWIVCRAVAKLAFKRKMNEQFERALRILGGIAVAILVAYLLFRFGSGWGLGGSGSGEGQGTGTSGQSDDRPNDSPKTDPKKSQPAEVLSSTLKVRIEAATSYPKTFRFESSPEGVELAAAKKALEDFRGKVKGEPRLEIQVYQNSTAVDHAAVREFMDHAHALNYATRVDKIGERVP
jgi:hypothetical protein